MHVHAHGPRTKLVLTFGAVATLAYVLLAFLVGLHAHSLALISEAGHNLTDFLALLLSWVGLTLASRRPTAEKTFGYGRASALAALANVITLFVVSALIIVEAVARFRTPAPVATGPMIWVAAIGLVMNAAIAFFLHRGHSAHDVNLRAAVLHMLGDALATALVLLGAIVIAQTHWIVLDPILSLAIAALILVSGWGVLRDTLNILLEAAPKGIRSADVAAALTAVEGVEAVHELHIWTLGTHALALSAHVQIADIPPSQSDPIRLRLTRLLASQFAITHPTLQFEHLSTCPPCSLDTPHS